MRSTVAVADKFVFHFPYKNADKTKLKVT